MVSISPKGEDKIPVLNQKVFICGNISPDKLKLNIWADISLLMKLGLVGPGVLDL